MRPRWLLRQRFLAMAAQRKVTVFADPVEADSADRGGEQYDQADQDEADTDIPRDVGHQQQGRGDENVQQRL